MNTATHTIHFEDMHSILQAIRYAKPLPCTALQVYLTAQHILSDNMPGQLRDYLTIQWLTTLITSQYNIHRRYHGLVELSPDTPKQDLIRHIRDDYMLSNPELESWSVVFVRYVCLNAKLSTDEHEKIAQMTKRTLRRRQKQGLEQVYLHVLLS